jgi:hypothetical protein
MDKTLNTSLAEINAEVAAPKMIRYQKRWTIADLKEGRVRSWGSPFRKPFTR